MKVTVHDCLPGTGKSSRMIEKINESDPDTRWIVVVPFLAECHRYAGTLIDPDSLEKQLPLRDERGVIYTGLGCSESGRRFQHPVSGYRSKVEHIGKMVEEGKDIVTTHAALKLFTPDMLDGLKDAGYRLVIDEELECIRPHPTKAHRRKMLLTSGAVYVDESGLLRWDEGFTIDEKEVPDDTGYSWEMRIKALCDNGSLVLIEDDKGQRDLFMWEYPIEFIRAFDHIDVLTYLFEGSIFEKYLSFYGIPYTIERGVQLLESPFDLINIVDNEKMNRVGEREGALSATDQRKYTKVGHVPSTLKANLENYYKNTTYTNSKQGERLWTCLNESLPVLKGKGYTKRHTPHNLKAVNSYIDTHHLAYVYNSYMHPEPFKYLSNRGEEFAPDMERHSLSELIQWMFRSRIRRGEPVTVYVPSSRMRGLLLQWMEG